MASLLRGSVFVLMPFLFVSGCKRNFHENSATPVSLPSSSAGLFAKLMECQAPVVVAHGKNVNVAEESTWLNLATSVVAGADVLEFDLQLLRPEQTPEGERGLFLVFHDPTPHRLVRGYSTSREKEEQFVRTSPELSNAHWGGDRNLFDRIFTYSPEEAKKYLWIYDVKSGTSQEPILFDETLEAIKEPGVFQIPPHTTRYESGKSERIYGNKLPLKRPLFYYVDMKDINPYARRLSGLGTWDWVMASWSDEKIEEYVNTALRSLSTTLTKYNAHDAVFLAVRHPKLAQMVRGLDAKIHIMASPESITPDTPVDVWSSEVKKFEQWKPELVEVKYLKHIVSPALHSSAREMGMQVFYNEIEQTDTTQFEEPYKGKLDVLLKDILTPSQDVFIQTNTVQNVSKILESNGKRCWE